MNASTTAPRPQHLRALARANEIRLARASLKRRVADGTLSVADVVLDCPTEAETMSMADLLMSQRRWGLSRCRKFLQAIPLTETKAVGTLTERQRLAVAGSLAAAGSLAVAGNLAAQPYAIESPERGFALESMIA